MWAPCGRKQGRQPGRGRARPRPRSGGRRGAEVREGSRPPGHWGGLSGRAGVALGRRVAPRWAGGLAGHLASEDTAGILGASAQGTAWPAGSQVTCDAGAGWAWRARVGLGQRGRRLPHAGLVGAEPAPPFPPLSKARAASVDPGLWLQGFCCVPAVWPARVTYSPRHSAGPSSARTAPAPAPRDATRAGPAAWRFALLPFVDVTSFSP